MNVSPAEVHALAPTARHEFLLAFVDALQPVFLVGAGLTAVAFLLSLLLQETPLRATTAQSETVDDGAVIVATGRMRSPPRCRPSRSREGSPASAADIQPTHVQD